MGEKLLYHLNPKCFLFLQGLHFTVIFILSTPGRSLFGLERLRFSSFNRGPRGGKTAFPDTTFTSEKPDIGCQRLDSIRLPRTRQIGHLDGKLCIYGLYLFNYLFRF